MTIETIYEVSCDGCMLESSHEEDTNKAELWKYLKERGWRRRGQFLWCSRCVENGTFARNHVEWRPKEEPQDEREEGDGFPSERHC
jgi:hypothetical protein